MASTVVPAGRGVGCQCRPTLLNRAICRPFPRSKGGKSRVPESRARRGRRGMVSRAVAERVPVINSHHRRLSLHAVSACWRESCDCLSVSGGTKESIDREIQNSSPLTDVLSISSRRHSFRLLIKRSEVARFATKGKDGGREGEREWKLVAAR